MIIEIKIKKLGKDYNYFSLIFRTKVIILFVQKIGPLLIKLPYEIIKN